MLWDRMSPESLQLFLPQPQPFPVHFQLPAAYLLSLTGDVNNIWWAFIIAEGASAVASFIGMQMVYNKDLKNL